MLQKSQPSKRLSSDVYPFLSIPVLDSTKTHLTCPRSFYDSLDKFVGAFLLIAQENLRLPLHPSSVCPNRYDITNSSSTSLFCLGYYAFPREVDPLEQAYQAMLSRAPQLGDTYLSVLAEFYQYLSTTPPRV